MVGMEQFIHSFANFPTFLITWLTFSAAAAITFLLVVITNREKITFLGFLRHCFPFSSWREKSARMDIKLYFLGKLTDKTYSALMPLCTVLVSGLIGKALKLTFPNHVIIHPNYVVIVCCALTLFIVIEFSTYFTHYLQHHVPVLWEIHKVHHSATFLNPLTARRGHPLGFVFDGSVSAILAGIPAGIFGAFFGFGLADALFLYACADKIGTIVTLDALKHSHFPISYGWLDRVLISPYMHQVHHSIKPEHWGKNFGINLSIWDWIFGTAVKPAPHEEIIYGFGTGEEKDYDGLWGVYAGPLAKMWRLIVGRDSNSTTGLDAPKRRPIGAGVLWRTPSAAAAFEDDKSLVA